MKNKKRKEEERNKCQSHTDKCIVCEFKDLFIDDPNKEDYKDLITRDVSMMAHTLYELEDQKLIPRLNKPVKRDGSNTFDIFHESLATIMCLALWKVQDEVDYDKSKEETKH